MASPYSASRLNQACVCGLLTFSRLRYGSATRTPWKVSVTGSLGAGGGAAAKAETAPQAKAASARRPRCAMDRNMHSP
jgi:hypothetical protein